MRQLSVPVNASDRIQGSMDALITLLEYGDYDCSRCGQLYPVIQEIQKQVSYPLRFAFRHFPLTTIHPMAQYAAEMAEAANAQGFFWEIHDYLFRHQHLLGNSNLLQFVGELGLDVDRFERETAEHMYAPRVQEHIASGIASCVNGTPTFFINGIRQDNIGDKLSLLTAVKKASLS